MNINIECVVGKEPHKKSVFTSTGNLNIELEKVSDMVENLAMYIDKFYVQNKRLITKKLYPFLTIKATMENETVEVVVSKYDFTHDLFYVTETCILVFKALLRGYCHNINDFSLNKELDDSLELTDVINEMKYMTLKALMK